MVYQIDNINKDDTIFTFTYPTGNVKDGMQIMDSRGYCLDTNPHSPGNNQNYIIDSWRWNPKCYSVLSNNEKLKQGQVGFKLNKNNQLEFGSSGKCLDMHSFSKFSDCKENKDNENTKFTISRSM